MAAEWLDPYTTPPFDGQDVYIRRCCSCCPEPPPPIAAVYTPGSSSFRTLDAFDIPQYMVASWRDRS